MADLGSLQRVVEESLRNAPPNANPFLVIKAAVAHALSSGSRTESYEIQLIVQAATSATIGFLIGAGLVVRVKKGSFWIVRVRSGYILPHFVVGWASFGVVFFFVVLGYNLSTLDFVRGEIKKDAVLWRTLVGLPAWVSGWLGMWVLLVSYLQQSITRGKVFRLAPPWAVNSFLIVMPILFCISAVFFAVMSSRPYIAIVDTYHQIDAMLDTQAKAYSGSFTLFDLAPELGLVQNALKEATDLQVWIRRTFWAFAAWALFLLLCLLGSGFLQLRHIRQSLRSIQRRRAPPSEIDSRAGGASHGQALTDGTVSNESALRQSYGSLLVTMCGFIAIDVAQIGFCIYVALTSDNILLDSKGLMVATLGNVYSFLIPAAPVSILLLIRSLTQQTVATSGSSSSGHRTGPISPISPTVKTPFKSFEYPAPTPIPLSRYPPSERSPGNEVDGQRRLVIGVGWDGAYGEKGEKPYGAWPSRY